MNSFITNGDLTTIIVTRRDKSVHNVLVDTSDWVWLQDYTVGVQKHHNGFRALVFDKGQKKLHRFLLDAPDYLEVEHIDGNQLNNRRSNIVLCTRLENMQNRQIMQHTSSGERGVSWYSRDSKWKATVKLNNIVNTLGYFDTIEEAAVVVKTFRAKHMPFSKEARGEY